MFKYFFSGRVSESSRRKIWCGYLSDWSREVMLTNLAAQGINFSEEYNSGYFKPES